MRELLLLRHAKSSWADPGQQDIDRPLNARGSAAAAAIGRAMVSRGLRPDRILCSPARRTRETWARASQEFDGLPTALMLDELYDFGDGEALHRAVARNGGTASRLLVVAHNPAIHGLALALTQRSPQALRRQIEEKYPTGALAILGFDIDDWAKLVPMTGKLIDFLRPRDLPRADET